MQVNIDWNKFDSELYKPLVNMDIPDYNPGTIAYDDFWDEQDERCLNGYKPRAFMPKITNVHYFYLNQCNIELLEPGATRKTKGSPFYREVDRRLYDEFDDAKRHKFGLIVGKPRRVGLSWFGSSVCTYELLFYLSNKVGVAAGQDDKAQDFYEKVKYLLDNVREEYRAGISVKNDDEIRLSYKYRENKQDHEGGLQSSMYMKTMYAKPTGFEGKTLSLAIFEEAGLFEDIIAAYKSTEPCFREGAIQFGTPLIYGTGGEIDKGSKGYKTMWNNPQKYNLKKVFVSATDYYPGDGFEDEKTGKKISFFDFKTGRTNSKAAYNYIMTERQQKEGSEGYVKHIQSYPLKESDIFIKNSGGLLNRKKLNAQKNNLENCPYPITTGRLEWETDDPATIKLIARAKNLKEIDKIHFNRGSKIVFKEDEELGTVKKIMDPIDHSRLPFNPDIAGCDSYDDEVAEGTGSLGATIIYRCFYSPSKPYDMPIAYILDRGTSDEDDKFYSDTFRLCVYYDVEMLLEYTKILIKSYFEGVGGLKHLKPRPELEGQGYNSKAVNQYGFKMSNQHAFNLIVKLLRQEVNLNFTNIWFDELLDHLIDFGEVNADLGSAYGMVMISKLDMFGALSEDIEQDANDISVIDQMGHWTRENGKMVWKTYREAHGDNPYEFDSRGSIFDPEFDLVGEEKQAYEESKHTTREMIKEKQEEIMSKYGNDAFAFVMEEHNRKLRNN
jgi:hypothetical protein